MTLAEALRVLHEAGRIRSPWLPGMLILQHGAIVARLAWWDGTHWHASYDREPGVRGGWLRFLPGDLLRTRNHTEVGVSDPATRGCLLALLREASGWAGCHVTPPDHPGDRWAACYGRPQVWEHAFGPTEAAALTAALIAVAQEVDRG